MPGKRVLNSLMRRAIWLLSALFVFCINVNSQNYFFDNYGIKQGLSEQKVYKLYQDSKDYIWLGTANGLSRFDGKKFENFSANNGLETGGVISICEDSLGNIWFGHNSGGGITRYNGARFEQVAFDSLKITGDITSIQITGNLIWFTSTTDGAIQADFPVKNIKHLKARQFRGKEGLGDQVYGSNINRDGSFICIADVGLRRFNLNDKKFENYRMPHMTTYFNTTCLLNDSKGNLWFGTYNGGLYKYIMQESRMEFIDLYKSGVPSNWVYCLTEDSKGRIWVGTFGGGIAVFDGPRMRKFNESNGLKALKIYDIIEDAEGNILIADQNNGLTIFKGDAFENFSDKQVLPDLSVNAIYRDTSGSVWFGTNAGISVYRPGEEKKTLVFDKTGTSSTVDVRSICGGNDGGIWIGTNGSGIIRYDQKTRRFEPQTYINSILYRDGQVKALTIDNQNHLWIGTNEGLAIGTIGQQNFQRYTLLDSITVTVISTLYSDPAGNVWIGTQPSGSRPGLIKYVPAKKEFRPVPNMAGVMPKALVMDRKGILWVGTAQGLLALRNDSIIRAVSVEDGLLSNNINLLAEGNDGSIYIGTNIGLNRYFPGSGIIHSFTEKNGFTGIETKQNSVFKCREGDIWFGTANGATHLMPDKIDAVAKEPLTHIMGMRVNYEVQPMVPGLKLNHDARSILFDYYSICLRNPDVVAYKVKLDGADEGWRPVTDQTRAYYPVLPPGKYTFNVVAKNSEGIWNKQPVSYHFVIKPPFYYTWWFIMVCIILIAVAVITYIKIREQNLKRENIILEEKVKERTAEVVQKSLELEEKNKDITASIRYAERIQRAMLPKEDTFPETFVLFMPKDIVSGDFYWMYDNGDIQFMAVVDCTGHGVPGAFMSIIGHNSLNKVVREYGLTRPSAILDQLNNEVMKALLQRHEKAITDGMDLALIAFNKKNLTLEYAGAYHPLYLVRNGEVIIYKADRFPIGMRMLDEKKHFTNHEVEIMPGDMLYMFSDGYADQFGSDDKKKYKSANIKKFLASIWHLPVNEQRERLEREIMTWKGNLNQVDDILFIGTKIP